jgi:drug resistance transporter, Bcr/CflA subfamily
MQHALLDPQRIERHGPDRGMHRRLVVLLGALGAFGPLSMDMYLPSLPTLTSDLHAAASLGQLSITACLIGLAAGQMLIGPYSDSHGRKGPLLTGLILFAATSFLCAHVSSVTVLIMLRFLQGLAGSAGLVISRAVARDLYSGPALTKFFSMLMAINGIFPILAPILGGLILKTTSWRGVFIVLTVIGVILFLCTLFGLPETLPAKKRITGGMRATVSEMGRICRDRSFIGYAVVLGLIMGAMFCYISGSSFVLQDMFGVSPIFFSLFFATNGLGIVAMSQLAGPFSEKWGEKKVLRIGVMIAALGSIALFSGLLLNPPRLIAVMLPLFFVVSMVGLVNTTAFSLAMQSQGRAAGTASAILGLGMNLIGGLFSPLVGLGGTGTYFPMALMILLCDIGALIVYLLLIRTKA